MAGPARHRAHAPPAAAPSRLQLWSPLAALLPSRWGAGRRAAAPAAAAAPAEWTPQRLDAQAGRLLRHCDALLLVHAPEASAGGDGNSGLSPAAAAACAAVARRARAVGAPLLPVLVLPPAATSAEQPPVAQGAPDQQAAAPGGADEAGEGAEAQAAAVLAFARACGVSPAEVVALHAPPPAAGLSPSAAPAWQVSGLLQALTQALLGAATGGGGGAPPALTASSPALLPLAAGAALRPLAAWPVRAAASVAGQLQPQPPADDGSGGGGGGSGGRSTPAHALTSWAVRQLQRRRGVRSRL